MADSVDTVSDLRDFGTAVSGNNSGPISSDNSSDHGRTVELEDEEISEDREDSPPGRDGMCDPEHTEERFRVDRKKLEEMLQGAENGNAETGEDFFQRIMQETDTRITWPSKLKIGAKSKKDPHIKVTGRMENITAARDKIMSVLDTKSNRVTLKMDVSYTEHSHVIGKGGNIIRKVMQDTGCHIHFPDSNRGSQQEKSNQVSIAGQIGGVERARAKVRELLPLVLVFELPISNNPAPDINSPTIQHIVQLYNIGVNMRQRAQGYSTTVTVRGSSSNAAGVKEGTLRLMEHLNGNLGVTCPVSTQIEIPQHHQFMSGRSGMNIKRIMQDTGATIHFPDPNSTQRKSTVFISGPVDSVVMARQLLMGCLPLVLMFDVKDELEVDSSKLSQLMEQLDVLITVKPKPRQPSKSVVVKSIERNAASMYRARQALLGQKCENFVATYTGTSVPLSVVNVAGLGLLNSSLVNVNTTSLLSLTGLPVSRVSPMQISQSSVSGPSGPSPSVSQPLTAFTHSFPAGVASVLISQQAIKPLPVQPSHSALQSPNALQGHISLKCLTASQVRSTLPSRNTLQSVSPKAQNLNPISFLDPVSNPTQAPDTNLTSNPNVIPPLYPASNPFHAPSPSPTSPPCHANLLSSRVQLPQTLAGNLQGVMRPAAEPTPAYMLSAASSKAANTVINAVPQGVTHRIILPTTLRANPQPESPKSVLLNAMAEQLRFMPKGNISQPDAHRAIRPSPHQPERQRGINSSLQRGMHPTSPPPGLTKADPVSLSTELQRFDMAAKAARLMSSRGGEELMKRITEASQIDRQLSSQTKQGVMASDLSNTSSSTSPNLSPCTSPIDPFTIPMTSPINPLAGSGSSLGNSSNSNSSGGSGGSGNNINSPKLVDLGYLQSNISPSGSSGSGSLSGVLMGSGGRGSSALLADGTLGFTAYHAANGGRSSESGGDSDSSDKRAPGCERRDWERERGEWERGRGEWKRGRGEWEAGREDERQEELDRLDLQSTSTSYSGVDLNRKKLMADKAMKKKPVVSEVRHPTDQWSGLGFSKSMPESAHRDLRKPNGFSLFHAEKLPTTYENALKEETKNGTNESSWPVDHSGALEDLMTLPPTTGQQQTSAAPGQYPANRKNIVIYNNLSCSNYIEGSSLPSQSKSLWPHNEGSSNSQVPSSKLDLADLFINLGLGKYADVFQQQEIDLSTFLTLTDNDLKELGIATFGARRKMCLAISDMNKTKTKPFLFSTTNSSSLLHEGSNGSNGLINHGRENPTSVW